MYTDDLDPDKLMEIASHLIILKGQIKLLDCIGQGTLFSLLLQTVTKMYIGEFGIVYKAHYYKNEGYPTFVAVKTLKSIYIYIFQYFVLLLYCSQ